MTNQKVDMEKLNNYIAGVSKIVEDLGTTFKKLRLNLDEAAVEFYDAVNKRVK